MFILFYNLYCLSSPQKLSAYFIETYDNNIIINEF